MTPDYLPKLLQLVKATRSAQRTYFSSRTQTNLRLAQQAERILDEYVRLLEARGVIPSADEQPKQDKLF